MIDASAAGSGAPFGIFGGGCRGCGGGAALSHAASPRCISTPKFATPWASVPLSAQLRSFS